MSSLKPSASKVAFAIIGFGFGTIAWFLSRQRATRNRLKHPDAKAWQRIGTVKEINMYPVTSAAALQLEHATCDTFGLCSEGFRDRRLLLVRDTRDDKNAAHRDNNDINVERVCFADKYPAMLSIRSELVAFAEIRLSAPNAAPIIVDLPAGNFTEKIMHGFLYQVVECQAEHHAWFSQVILQRETGMRLYIMVDPVLESSWWRTTKYNGAPITVMHEKSVADLNARLSVENQAHHLQFRSNILIATDARMGVTAFDEDNWLWCRIGDGDGVSGKTILRCMAPCLRCVVVNLNVDTCRPNRNGEPLKTLKKYRLRSSPDDPEIGLYFQVYKRGMVHKGDNVYIQYRVD